MDSKKKDNINSLVFSTEIVNNIIDKENKGIPLLRNEKIWLKNLSGVRKPGLKFGMTQHELAEYLRCKLSVQYFAEKYCQIKREDGSIGPMKLRDYQKDIIDLYTKSSRAILMASRQCGKAQDLDSVVWSERGKMRFGDLQLNDKIYDDNGELTNVVGIYPQGTKDIYEIEFSDGLTVRSCDEHLWEVSRYNKNVVLELSEIRKNYLTKRGDSIYYVKVAEPVNFPTKDLPLDPYLLGIILGDGSTRNNRLSISTNDIEIINYLKTLEDDDIYIKKLKSYNNKPNYDYGIMKKNKHKKHKIIEQLRKLDLMDKYSYNKLIPQEYLYGDINQRISLLQGLMDTDGTISKNYIISYCTTSKQLCDDFRQLAHSLGIRTSVKQKNSKYTYKGEKKIGRLSYVITLHVKNDYKYDIFRLIRKQSNVKNKRYDWGQKRGIVNIKYVGKMDAQCIEVDNNSHLYLTDHFIPTHNTVSAAIVLLHFCLFNDDKNVMIVANKGTTVIEILDKIKRIYMLLPFFLKRGVIKWNEKALTFDNGCSLKTEKRTKEPAIGFTIDLLYLDEFAKIPNNIIRPYYTSVVPVVSSVKNSKIIITSTPDGYNLFHELLMGAEAPKGDPMKNPYKSLRVYWWQIPGRRDTKIYFLEPKLEKYNVNPNDVLKYLETEYEHIIHRDQEDGEVVYKIKFDADDDRTSLEKVRQIRYNNIPLPELCIITNWQEQETKLIGGEDAFKQEYDLQFIAGNKLLFDNVMLEKIKMGTERFEWQEIPKITNKFKLPYTDLQFVQDRPDLFDINKAKDYYIMYGIDLSEGLAQDYTVINIFRLMPKDPDTIKKYKNKFDNIYDYFKLEQIGIFKNNIYSLNEVAHLFYLIAFELFDSEKSRAALEFNTYGGEFLSHLPYVFDQNNDYSNGIFFRYYHRKGDVHRKVGLKVTGGEDGKKVMVKDYQTNVRKGNIVLHNDENIKELFVFTKKETPNGSITYQSESGHDDTVMSVINLSTCFNLTQYKDIVDSYMQHEMDSDMRKLIEGTVSNATEDSGTPNLDIFSSGHKNIYNRNMGGQGRFNGMGGGFNKPNSFSKFPVKKSPFGN